MPNNKYITFFLNKKENMLDKSAIVYAEAGEKHKTKIHTSGGEIYDVRITLGELEETLGKEFVKVRRNALVRASEIESLTDNVNLKNGDSVRYTQRQKRRIIERVMGITASPPTEEKVF